MVVPNNHSVFLLKMIILGWRLGVPPFKETPISGVPPLYLYIIYIYRNIHITLLVTGIWPTCVGCFFVSHQATHAAAAP